MTHVASSVRTFGICITPQGLVGLPGSVLGMHDTCPICGAFWDGVNV